MRQLMETGIQVLRDNHVDYGDIRIGFYRNQNITVRDTIPTNLSDNESSGFGIRAFFKGYWGFASSSEFSQDAITRVAKRAVEIARAAATINNNPLQLTELEKHTSNWKVDFKIDPFSIPLIEKVQLLRAINEKMLSNSEIKQAFAIMRFTREHKLFFSTIGTFTDQLLIRSLSEYTATAVNKNGFETRSYITTPLNKGYEHIDADDLLANAKRIAREAVEKLNAPLCPVDEVDLVLLPTHTALVIHETIGHATELDRVLGWEADFAGTSFATPEKLGNFRYGSEIFNVVGDRTMPNGRASVPFDDDGVPTSKWHLIKNGVLNGYGTTRDTAPLISKVTSNGCSYADSWNSMPILRMPNVSIEPGPDGSPSLKDIIASTDKGILVDGRASFSIDHQRINFQFGGDFCNIIEKGRIGGPLRRLTYQSSNPEFWNSVDAIAPQNEWKPFGVTQCGKGQPMQIAQLTHGSSPLRLRKIKIGVART